MEISVPKILNRSRILAGKTQLTIAKEIGVSATMVGHWENDDLVISKDKLKRIAEVIDISFETLKQIENGETVSNHQELIEIEAMFKPRGINDIFYDNVIDACKDKEIVLSREMKAAVNNRFDIKLSRMEEIAKTLDMDLWALLMED